MVYMTKITIFDVDSRYVDFFRRLGTYVILVTCYPKYFNRHVSFNELMKTAIEKLHTVYLQADALKRQKLNYLSIISVKHTYASLDI